VRAKMRKARVNRVQRFKVELTDVARGAHVGSCWIPWHERKDASRNL
jgi:hypothetical protein